jgi:hypothetical protein
MLTERSITAEKSALYRLLPVKIEFVVPIAAYRLPRTSSAPASISPYRHDRSTSLAAIE